MKILRLLRIILKRLKRIPKKLNTFLKYFLARRIINRLIQAILLVMAVAIICFIFILSLKTYYRILVMLWNSINVIWKVGLRIVIAAIIIEAIFNCER